MSFIWWGQRKVYLIQLHLVEVWMKELIIYHFREEAKNVNSNNAGCGDYGIQEWCVQVRRFWAHLHPAIQTAEEGNIRQYVPMIEQSPVPRLPIDHIKPVEIPNEAHGGSVKPLSKSAVHEIGLGSPGAEEENYPRANEVGENEAGQHGGEQGEGGEARRDEKQIPEEVDHRGGHLLLLLVNQEGAQGAVVHGDAAGDGQGRPDGLQHWGGGDKGVIREATTGKELSLLLIFDEVKHRQQKWKTGYCRSQMKKGQSNVTYYSSHVTSFLISVLLLDGWDAFFPQVVWKLCRIAKRCFLKGAFSHFYWLDLNLPLSYCVGGRNLTDLKTSKHCKVVYYWGWRRQWC